MKTGVKICGLTTPASVQAALTAGADAVGLVFFPPSPRFVSPVQAGELVAVALSGDRAVKRVGVFVDADDELLAAAIRTAKLDVVQAQGSEDPARVAAIRARFGIEVWKAVGVQSTADIVVAEQAAATSDALLLDARAAPGAELPGGNGLRFDWRILAGRRPAMPWVLAGGLDCGNVAEAIRLTRAPFVDVSSGVEDAPGVKNLAKIAAFVEAARRV